MLSLWTFSCVLAFARAFSQSCLSAAAALRQLWENARANAKTHEKVQLFWLNRMEPEPKVVCRSISVGTLEVDAGAQDPQEPLAKKPCTSQPLTASRVGVGRGERLQSDDVAKLMSLRRLVGGSIDYHIAADGLKRGPTCMEQVSGWPRLMVEDFFNIEGGRERLFRLGSLLESGLVVHTDCSGKCSPEASLELLDVALQDYGLHLPTWLACTLEGMRLVQALPEGHSQHGSPTLSHIRWLTRQATDEASEEVGKSSPQPRGIS
jgi:hypothetical protein